MNEPDYADFHKKLVSPLFSLGMDCKDSHGTLYELYLPNFATVALSINRAAENIVVEKYYDSPVFDDRYTEKVFPFVSWERAVKLCEVLIKGIKADQPLFEGSGE